MRQAEGDKTAKARQVGKLLAERAIKAGVECCGASTALATHITAGSRPSPTARARAGWPL